MKRRRFLASLTAFAALPALGGGAGSRATADQVLWRTLPRPNGAVPGYRGLADLPYFDLDASGQLRLVPALRETLPPAIDFHSHLGLAVMFAPHMDYHAEASRAAYVLDCDLTEPPCDMAMDDYLNKIANDEMTSDMHQKLLSYGWFGGSDAARTHTIPTLVAEMDAVHVQRAVLLVVAPRVPFRNNNTYRWLDALQASPHRDRFVLFGAVDHPLNDSAPAQIKEMFKRGVQGVKMHPTMQQFAPNDPKAMRLYEVAERLGMHVFFHAGRAGIEPAYTQQFARMRNYIEPAKAFPKLQFVFGHAGARDWEEAMVIARDHDNVWLEIEGQGVEEMKTIMRVAGPHKMLYGSDWPFFPLAAMMARVLMATEGQPEARRMILSDNANRLLAKLGPM